jgi:REP element-mobilizing transposase RayT
VLKKAFVLGCKRDAFRVCQFSVQGNHLHLICEARDAMALARGIQGFKIRVARGLNRLWGRRGYLFNDRYHAEILTCPTQVRNTLVYVLQNGLRHWEQSWKGIDICSSAWHFDGWVHELWRRGLVPPHNPDRPPVADATTWLLATGWRRQGLIAPGEIPAAAR